MSRSSQLGVTPFRPEVLPEPSKAQAGLKLFEAALAQFALDAARSLRRMSGKDLTVKVGETRRQPFGELVEDFAQDTLWHVLRSDGLKTPGLWLVPGSSAAVLTEIFHGGSGQPRAGDRVPGGGGVFAARLMQRLVSQLLGDLNAALTSLVADPGCRFTRQEKDGALAAIMPNAERALAVPLTIAAAGRSLAMTLVLPLAAIERATRARSAPVKDPAERLAEVALRLGDVEVEVLVSLGEATLAAQDLLNLEVGDVIELSLGVDQALELSVEGQLVAVGRPGISRGHRALRIVKAS